MKKHYLYSITIMFLVTSLYDICAKNTLGQAQELHRSIGKTLVQIRRENPTLEKPIYSLFDQVGQLNKLVSVSSGKRKKLKATLLEEKQLRLSMNNEIEKSKSEVNSLRQALKQENSKFLENKKSLESLAREKLDLQKKVIEIAAQREKEKEFTSQSKKPDESAAKAEELLKELVSHPQPIASQSVVVNKKEGEKKG